MITLYPPGSQSYSPTDTVVPVGSSRQVKSSSGATNSRSEHPDPDLFLPLSLRGALARSEWGRPLGGTSAWRPATVTAGVDDDATRRSGKEKRWVSSQVKLWGYTRPRAHHPDPSYLFLPPLTLTRALCVYEEEF